MSEPLIPELEQKAQEFATRIKSRSADAILDIARHRKFHAVYARVHT